MVQYKPSQLPTHNILKFQSGLVYDDLQNPLWRRCNSRQFLFQHNRNRCQTRLHCRFKKFMEKKTYGKAQAGGEEFGGFSVIDRRPIRRGRWGSAGATVSPWLRRTGDWRRCTPATPIDHLGLRPPSTINVLISMKKNNLKYGGNHTVPTTPPHHQFWYHTLCTSAQLQYQSVWYQQLISKYLSKSEGRWNYWSAIQIVFEVVQFCRFQEHFKIHRTILTQ